MRIQFPQFILHKDEKLVQQGYWYVQLVDGVLGYSTAKPLNRKAQFLSLTVYLLPVVFYVIARFVTPLWHFAIENPLMIIVIYLVVNVLIGIIVDFKTYKRDSFKLNLHKEEDRSKFYNADESIYTTKSAGIYICRECSTPVATTDQKSAVKGQNIIVKELLDTNLVNQEGSDLVCSECRAKLGIFADNQIQLDGEKIMLDASSQLHNIYS